MGFKSKGNWSNTCKKDDEPKSMGPRYGCSDESWENVPYEGDSWWIG